MRLSNSVHRRANRPPFLTISHGWPIRRRFRSILFACLLITAPFPLAGQPANFVVPDAGSPVYGG